MPFFCCIRKLKEPENELTLVQSYGDPREKKLNANGVSTPIIDVGLDLEETDKDKSDESSKENHKTQNKVTPSGDLNSSALSTTRTEQELDDEKEPFKKETFKIQEQAAGELDSEGHADNKTQGNEVDVQKYEELVSRLEDITDRIEIQFKEDFPLSTEEVKELKTAAHAADIKPVEQPALLDFIESSKLWHARNISDDNSTNIDAEVGQSVKISDCRKATFRINGKVDKLEISDCTSCSVVVEEVGEVTISTCKKLELQVLKNMSVVRASDVDGLLMYLNECNAKVTKFFTRKCSEVNFCCPTGDGQVELALPEQVSSQWNGQELVSEAFTHKG